MSKPISSRQRICSSSEFRPKGVRRSHSRRQMGKSTQTAFVVEREKCVLAQCAVSLNGFCFSFVFVRRSQLPARSTRLLNRSRLQGGLLNGNYSDSQQNIDSSRGKKSSPSRSSTQFGRNSANHSPDDHLYMLDKSLRNSMIQDVLFCKQQLLALRSLLQEVSDKAW